MNAILLVHNIAIDHNIIIPCVDCSRIHYMFYTQQEMIYFYFLHKKIMLVHYINIFMLIRSSISVIFFFSFVSMTYNIIVISGNDAR